MNSNKQVSLKRLKNPRRSKLTHLPSQIVTSPQINAKVVTLDSDLSNDDSITDEILSMVDVKPYYHGEFKAVTPSWQSEKCRVTRLTFVTGILYENEAADKSIEIRQLIPTREKRISADGNCLFRSLSYLITRTDYNHREIRELIIDKIKGEYRTFATNYVQARKDVLPEGRCNSIEDYLRISKMDQVGSWGTDLEIFLAAITLSTDIFVYNDEHQSWLKFSGHGFNDAKSTHDLTERRVYLRLNMNHFQPIIKVNTRIQKLPK